MCIIVVKKASLELAKEMWENCFENNDDGAGFCCVEEGKLMVYKGYFKFPKLWKDIEKRKDLDLIVHFRAASPGMKVNTENCHPFSFVTGKAFWDKPEARFEFAIAHNGRLSWKHSDTASDTAHFTNEFLKPYLGRDPYIFDDQLGMLMFEKFVGDTNKIAVMRFDRENGSHEIMIVNESKGHWKDKIWFSNSSYMYKKTTTVISQYLGYGGVNYGRMGAYADDYTDADGVPAKWRSRWRTGDPHPPVCGSDVDKFGWFWSYQHDAWANEKTKVIVKNLTYRNKPYDPDALKTKQVPVGAFEDEVSLPESAVKELNAEPQSAKDEGEKAVVPIGGIPSEDTDFDLCVGLDHLENYEIGLICKRATKYFKDIGFGKIHTKGMSTEEKVDALREAVREEHPIMANVDLVELDMWILSQIKNGTLELNVIVV